MRDYALIIIVLKLVQGQTLELPSVVCSPGSQKYQTTCRRELLNTLVGTASVLACTQPSHAAETIGKDPNCNDNFCLGVWDGLLADCPHNINFAGGAGCVASQDDTPGVFAEPWDYSESDDLAWDSQMEQLKDTILLVSKNRGDDVKVADQTGRYLRVQFVDGRSSERSVGEFYFTPSDTTVQFRLASLEPGSGGLLSSSMRNMDRAESVRKAMRYLKLPVLRNRRRSLFFVESDLDTFGPGSAALGPPAEMTTGELEGRGDIDPRKKLDTVQQFPFR